MPTPTDVTVERAEDGDVLVRVKVSFRRNSGKTSILVPEEGTRNVKLTAIPGTPPNLKRPPLGCRFAERCRYATTACKYNQMPILEFEDGRIYRCGMSVQELRELYRREDEAAASAPAPSDSEGPVRLTKGV